MIAIDLSPLVVDPFRGVSRALLHLLEGLRKLPHGELGFEGFAPSVSLEDVTWPPLGRLGLDAVHRGLPLRTGPGTWRRSLAPVIADRGARVFLSPWAAFPRTKVPVVAWIHEVPFVRHGALEGTLRTLRHRRALARAVERAAALVVPTESVKSDLVALHPAAARRTHVIPHGFDPSAAGVYRVELFGGLRTLSAGISTELPDGTFTDDLVRQPGYALLVGSGHGAGGHLKKGVDVFAKALDGGRVPGLRGVVIGKAKGLPPSIQVTPELDDASVKLWIQGARVVVVPSRSEGFGYPMLEAFAAGVPVVASAAGALPEVSGGAARLVPPGDADALAEAITRVATDEALRTRMIRDGKKRAGEFPVEAMARGWLRVLCQAGGLPCPV